jgi:hypothetical protein
MLDTSSRDARAATASRHKTMWVLRFHNENAIPKEGRSIVFTHPGELGMALLVQVSTRDFVPIVFSGAFRSLQSRRQPKAEP